MVKPIPDGNTIARPQDIQPPARVPPPPQPSPQAQPGQGQPDPQTMQALLALLALLMHGGGMMGGMGQPQGMPPQPAPQGPAPMMPGVPSGIPQQ